MARAIRFEENDNVVVLTEDAEAGETVIVAGTDESYTTQEAIAKGHKMATLPIPTGEYAVKFNVRIGRMMTDAVCGTWISEHNLADVTAELREEYVKAFREDGRTIQVYPRADGRFGIRNYVMVISTAPECNAVAEFISDTTGCAWMVCDRPHLENGRVSEYSKLAMGYTGCNPNNYAVLVLGATSEKGAADFVYTLIENTGKPVRLLTTDGDAAAAGLEGVVIIKGFMVDAAAQNREPRPIEGLTITVHCAGSDWTTTIVGNPTDRKSVV